MCSCGRRAHTGTRGTVLSRAWRAVKSWHIVDGRVQPRLQGYINHAAPLNVLHVVNPAPAGGQDNVRLARMLFSICLSHGGRIYQARQGILVGSASSSHPWAAWMLHPPGPAPAGRPT